MRFIVMQVIDYKFYRFNKFINIIRALYRYNIASKIRWNTIDIRINYW